jgi:hypothetical protein
MIKLTLLFYSLCFQLAAFAEYENEHDDRAVHQVPEPQSWELLATGLVAILIYRYLKKYKD